MTQDKTLDGLIEQMWNLMDKIFNAAFRCTGAKTRRHRIVSKDGHITITGQYKTLTVNGKKL